MKEIDDAFGYWFAGFTDGEGSFTIETNNRNGARTNYRSRFEITLRNDDKPVLEKIRDTLGIGNIAKKAVCVSDSLNARAKTRFRVDTINDCAELVKVFEKYQMQSKKQRDFDIWKTAVAELQKPIDCRDAELLEYCFQEIREIRKYERREDISIPRMRKPQLTIEFEDAVEEEGDRARRRVEGIVKNNKSAEKHK